MNLASSMPLSEVWTTALTVRQRVFQMRGPDCDEARDVE
jgi:hypothetical protein